MNRRPLLQAAAGLLLCALGYYFVRRESYEAHTVVASAGGCQMATDIYEPRSGSPVGSVVLFHGLAANKKVMSFSAQEFANQDLRVFAPDFPGHGTTPGPFSPARAEFCAGAFLRDLISRKAIIPERTILAGHSLGGAIAVRVAAVVPVAGVIAISPAPMHIAPGFSAEMLPFRDVPALPPHSLVLTGQWEPGPIKSLAQQLVAAAPDSTSRYQLIAGTTHVSILFSSKAFAAMRSWMAQLLRTDPASPLPANHPALGCVLGVIGLALLAPPFLREMTPLGKSPPSEAWVPKWTRTISALTAFSALAIILLRFAVPFRSLHLFQGDYLVSFLFLVGIAILVLFRKSLPSFAAFFAPSAAAAALVVALLFAAWLGLTFYEAWLTPARWLRLPFLFLLFLPWHLAEELLLGENPKSPNTLRVVKAFGLRSILWLGLLAGIYILHSGQVLLVLLAAYFVVFSILQRLACDLVRFRTQSSAAAAIFGAILFSAFALAIFPIA